MKPKNRITISRKQINPNNFHTAIKFSVQLAQWFGFFPIDIRGDTCKSLKFTWLHWRVGYALVTFITFVLEFAAQVVEQLEPAEFKTHGFMKINAVVFHVGALTHLILFFKLAKEWPGFVKNWHIIETSMRDYETLKKNLRKQLTVITSLIMALAAVEHTLVGAYKLKQSFEIEDKTFKALENYFKYGSYPHIFKVIDYNLWTGLILQFMNLQRTFLWTYVDVFEILIAAALTFRLRLITQRLKYFIDVRVLDKKIWKTLRKDYVLVLGLIKTVNEHMSYMLMTSFTLNIYFVLVQLFGTLLPAQNTIEKVYFVISFGLLLLRLISVCIFGGGVNEEWKNISDVLNSVHSTAYNEEVERLMHHVTTYEVALTGRNYFKISRCLLLKIAGAVVAYELVLIQFHKDTIKTGT